MAAEAKIKIWGELSGLGMDKTFSNNWTDGSTPTSGAGPNYMSVGSTPTQVDFGTSGVSVVRGVLLKAIDGIIYSSIVSTNVTIACYITTGNSNFYTFQSNVTIVPWVQASNTATNIEYWWYGV